MHSLPPASGLRRGLAATEQELAPVSGGPARSLLSTWPRVPGLCPQSSPSPSDMGISNSVP